MGALERKKAARARHSTRIRKPRSLEDCADRNMIENVCTPEQIARGNMQVTAFKMVETVVAGKIRTHVSTVIKNFDSTTLCRWEKHKDLDSRQIEAILFYKRNHDTLFRPQRITANWGSFLAGGSGTGGNEDKLNREISAKANLRLLDENVFWKWDPGDVCVFLDIVNEDSSAGIAGRWAGYNSKSRAEAAALQIVKSIAHQIALCVIDGRGGQAVKDAA